MKKIQSFDEFINESKSESFLFSFEEFVNEKRSEGILGSTDAVPLSAIDPKVARAAIDTGHNDGQKPDDVARGKRVSIPVKSLRAAQTEIIPEKAIGMAIGVMLGPNPPKIGGDLGSILSKDNYIMDGHHRWAATFLCDPSAKVEATQIDLPGKELVTALNVVTVGLFNREGNQGSGEIKDFTSAKIGALLDEYLTTGISGKFPILPEEIRERLGKVPGANGDSEKGKKIMMKNADSLPKQIMPGAPDRVDMPVIGPDEVKKVEDLIASGSVDLKEPYSKEVKSEMK